jgi:hypothetical protein
MQASVKGCGVQEQQQRDGDQLHLAPATDLTAHFMLLMMQGSGFTTTFSFAGAAGLDVAFATPDACPVDGGLRPRMTNPTCKLQGWSHDARNGTHSVVYGCGRRQGCKHDP